MISLSPRTKTKRGLRNRPKLECLYDCFSEFFLSMISNPSIHISLSGCRFSFLGYP